jgi:hypothetical protein
MRKKYIFYLLISTLLLGGLSSCDDFGDLNEDPTKSTGWILTSFSNNSDVSDKRFPGMASLYDVSGWVCTTVWCVTGLLLNMVVWVLKTAPIWESCGIKDIRVSQRISQILLKEP